MLRGEMIAAYNNKFETASTKDYITAMVNYAKEKTPNDYLSAGINYTLLPKFYFNGNKTETYDALNQKNADMTKKLENLKDPANQEYLAKMIA